MKRNKIDLLHKVLFTIVLYHCMAILYLYRPIFFLFDKIKLRQLLPSPKKKILFIENQTSAQAGGYYRVEIVKTRLLKDGFDVRVDCCFSEKQLQKVKNGQYTHWYQTLMIVKKTRSIFRAYFFDLVIVRRELLHSCQYGGLLFEKTLHLSNPKVILDMDDYMPDFRKNNKEDLRFLFNKINFYNHNKTNATFNIYKYYTLALTTFHSALTIENPAINEDNVSIFPMCVDYEKTLKVYDLTNHTKKVGWVSQKNHFPRLDQIVPSLNKAFKAHPFILTVIADDDYKNDTLLAPIENIRWSRDNELNEMHQLDIGIAPVFAEKSQLERTGTFKLLQYMSVGLVSLSTAFNYTEDLIADGTNGYLAYNLDDWGEKLSKILQLDSIQISNIGNLAYNTFYKRHHIDCQYESLKLFYLKVIND
jgi:glycosyltransferase involved in cell wall biosynthesis